MTTDIPVGDLQPDRVCTVAADDGVPLHAAEIDPVGSPDVTVVGVHGLGLSCGSWHFQRRAMALLAAPRVKQVYYDQRGHGRSGAVTDEAATVEQLGADLHAVIRALADPPVVILGHDLGGMAVIALAASSPELFGERVRGVSLIATSAGDVVPAAVRSRFGAVGWGADVLGDLAEWRPEVAELVSTASTTVTRQAMRRLVVGEAGAEVIDYLLHRFQATPVRELVRFLGSAADFAGYDALAHLKHTAVQVIVGAADMILPVSHSERIAAELPDAQLLRIDNAGHVPQLEQPETVNRHLIELTQRCCGVDPAPGDSVHAKRARRWFSS